MSNAKGVVLIIMNQSLSYTFKVLSLNHIMPGERFTAVSEEGRSLSLSLSLSPRNRQTWEKTAPFC